MSKISRFIQIHGFYLLNNTLNPLNDISVGNYYCNIGKRCMYVIIHLMCVRFVNVHLK